MRYMLQAIFNEPIGLPLLRDIRALGFDGVRVDVQRVGDQETCAAIINEIQDADLWPLVIIQDPVQLTPAWLPRRDGLPPPAAEFRNEPDLEGPSAGHYRMLLRQARFMAERFGVELWAGVVSNLIEDKDNRGLRYLRELAPDLPSTVSVHRYPNGFDAETPHEGFRSRLHEVERLAAIIGPRRFGVSEFGYHTARQRKTAKLPTWLPFNTRALTDTEVARRVAFEWRFWREVGAEFATLYQINDGPGTTAGDRYGIRRLNGSWKLSAATVHVDQAKARGGDDEAWRRGA